MANLLFGFRNWIAANRAIVGIAVAGAAVIWIFGKPSATATDVPRHLQPQASQSEVHKPVESAYAQLKRRCTTDLDAIKASAMAHMKQREYQFAFNVLDECKQFIVDPGALKLYQQATIELTKETKRVNAETERYWKSVKKKRGVSIGMSQQDVLESTWGRPQKINRTIRAAGTSEQWVYDGNFLYFEDGVLTAIQN